MALVKNIMKKRRGLRVFFAVALRRGGSFHAGIMQSKSGY